MKLNINFIKARNNPSVKARLTVKPKLSVSQKMLVRATALLLVLFTIGAIIYLQVGNVKNAAAGGLTGNFRSVASGNWSSVTIWQYNSGSGWVAATASPTTSASSVKICAGHTITVSANLSIDATIIEADGALVIAPGITLKVSKTSENDLTVNGALTINGTYIGDGSGTVINNTAVLATTGKINLDGAATVTVAKGGIFISNGTVSANQEQFIINSGGIYQHNVDGGVLPGITWNEGSNCLITGLTTSYPNGMDQPFANLTFSSMLMSNVEITSNLTCSGNLDITNTNGYALVLSNSNTNRTLTVGGDFKISNGKFTSVNAAGTGTINVKGSFNLSGGAFNMKNGTGDATLTAGNLNISGGTLTERSTTNTGASTIMVTGNFNMSSGLMDMSASGESTLNVAGNFSQTGGTITAGSSGNGNIVFNGHATQTYISGGTMSNMINYTVNSGASLTISNTLGSGSTGSFTLPSGATLNINDPEGISTSGATGNVRVAGTRTYNSNANYYYAATSAQFTGNGLPSTLKNLTVNNPNGLTLSSTLTVNGTLTLTSGKLFTGSYELQVANPSLIIGASPSNYIAGKLRYAVSKSGTYIYPIGSATNYEQLTVTLNNTTGFNSLLASFTKANPVNSSYPISVVASGAKMDKMLDHGYWTLTPNSASAVTGGTIDIQLSETGFSGSIQSSDVYAVLNRANATSSWQSAGNEHASRYINGALIASSSSITTFGDFGIGFGAGTPILAFDNHALVSGAHLQTDATYLIKDIGVGLDAWIQITDFSGGASLADFDNYTPGNGYNEAWQPSVVAAANDTSSVGWRVMFKAAGTSKDTVVTNFTFAAISLDGSGSSKEFAEAYQPGSISYSPASKLQIVNNDGNISAYAPSGSSIASADTGYMDAMFKVTYNNVSSFRYRMGIINTGETQVKQFSLYFKNFTSLSNTMLPMDLIHFTPVLNNEYVDLIWATASEINNDHFTVERSSNGIDFEEILVKPGAGNSATTKQYSASDLKPIKGISYYRLKQTDYEGRFAYSPVKSIMYGAKSAGNVSIQTIGPNPFADYFRINYNVAEQGNAEIQVSDNSGHIVYKETVFADKGLNTWMFKDHGSLPPGIYIVNIINNGEAVTGKVIKQ